MLPVFLAALLQSVSLVTDIAPATSRLPTRVLLVVPTSNALPTPMSTTRAEVGRIWRAAGVELTWLSRLPRGELSFDRVIAVVVDDAAFAGSALPVGALGGVPMVAGRMRQIVYLSPTAIKQLVAQAGVLPTGGQFGGAYARMVGRVIAIPWPICRILPSGSPAESILPFNLLMAGGAKFQTPALSDERAIEWCSNRLLFESRT